MKKNNIELQKRNATQKSMGKDSWWPKIRSGFKVCHVILKHVASFIRIFNFFDQIIL